MAFGRLAFDCHQVLTRFLTKFYLLQQTLRGYSDLYGYFNDLINLRKDQQNKTMLGLFFFWSTLNIIPIDELKLLIIIIILAYNLTRYFFIAGRSLYVCVCFCSFCLKIANSYFDVIVSVL